jgi:RNA polymerase sigma-70 factor, ECF subfamily
VLDAEVACDLLAETFAVAFERRRRFRDVGAPGAAWLYGIAAKELAHWFRRQEVERRAIRRLAIEVPPLDDESIARIEALADVDREALAAALEQMGRGERDASSCAWSRRWATRRSPRAWSAPRPRRECACTAGWPD